MVIPQCGCRGRRGWQLPPSSSDHATSAGFAFIDTITFFVIGDVRYYV
jgi:hypothetical protein